ncbi:hypothetical protein [Tateyamaria sp. Alg231-49]|uniref:hypothetical protein n=1 Tax=Tateyamaria sp. Alg231-49 TaxID=1922219 RepID=UPI000D55AE10|nr:hypothetical protein [Tateyamaria sp. Alg231-49]
MSSDPDPQASAPPAIPDEEMDRFTRRFLNFALKRNETETNQGVVDRRLAIREQATEDIRQLRAEFTAHEMKNYDAMTEGERAAELDRIFSDVTITAVPGAKTISINGVLEMDPASLRQLAPHKRNVLFAAANEADEDKRATALQYVSGKFRLRSKADAASGKTHLEGIVEGERADTLRELYEADSADKSGAYRAFDISNKLNALKKRSIDPGGAKNIQAYDDAVQKQRAMLAMALDAGPDNLSDMVVNFEFAEMTFDASVKEKAQAQAEARAAREHAEKVEEMRAAALTVEAQEAEIEKNAAALAESATQLGALLQKDFKQLEAEKKPLVIAHGKAAAALKKQRAVVAALTPEAIDRFAATAHTVSVTPADTAAATTNLIANMTAGTDAGAQRETLEAMKATLTEYTNAVTETGNGAAKVGVELEVADISLNAAEARKVARSLRFSDNKAAGYHTLKHHNEMKKPSDAEGYEFDTEVKKKVAHYHDCARGAVENGDVVLSQLEQNGGEGHHFKYEGITAIIKMAKNEASMATYFKK